jgi:hypothetical protein
MAAASAPASIIEGYMATAPSTAPPFTPNTYDPRYDRFTTNFPSEPPSTNTSGSFVLAGRDLSGIGWVTADPLRRLTMVTPRHFVAAAHQGLIGNYSPGASVSFLDAFNNVVTATVQSAVQVPSLGGTYSQSDIVLGTLTADVPSGVTSYPIPVGTDAQFVNRVTYHYDQEHRVGLNRVTNFFDNVDFGAPDNSTTNIVGFNFLPNQPGIGFNPGEIIYTANDSGSPTMLITASGVLSLLGVHFAIGNISGVDFSFDAFLPDYVTTINSLLTPGYSLTVVPVPEPSSIALVSIAALGVGRRFLRRHRTA